jgi:hypothetical protein
MKLFAWIKSLFTPKPENAAADDLKRAGDEPDVVPSETYMSQTRD